MNRKYCIATLAGLAASIAHAQDTHWTTAADGNWHDASRWNAGVPNSASAIAYIDTLGGYTVTLNASATVSQLYKFFPGPQLNLANGTSLFVVGGVFGNNGATVINPTAGGSGTQLRFDINSEIQAGAGQSGSITLNAHPANLDCAYINTAGAAVVTNTQHHLIDGTGNIYGNMINNGRILANVAGRTLQINGGNKTNTNQISAFPGGTLRISSATLTQTGSGFVSADHGTAYFTSSTLNGGALATVGTGTIVFEAGNTVNGTITGSGTLQLSNGGNIFLNGDWNNSGTLTINPTAGGSGTQFRADSASTINNATIVLNAHPANRDCAYLNTSGAATVLTIGQSAVVTGFGNIYAQLTNNGSILPDAAGESIQLLGSPKTNNATIRSSNTASVVLNGVTVNQTSTGFMEANGTGSTVDIYGSTVNGGTLAATSGGEVRIPGSNATFTGNVGGSGPFTVFNGNLLVLNQTTWNHAGTVTVNQNQGGNATYIRADQNCTINGAIIVLNAHPANRDCGYLQTNGATMTFGPTTTVTGFGRIHGATVNNGQILADAAGEVVELISSPKTNNNLIRASNGGLIMLNGVTVTQGPDGTLRATSANSFVDIYGSTVSGGSIHASGGGEAHIAGNNATFAGEVGGSGPLAVFNGNLLVLNQTTWNHAGTVTVNHNQGGNGTYIRADQNCTINGANIVLNSHPANRDCGYLQTNGTVMTFGPTTTVTGFGRIHGNTVNNGSILADATGEVVELLTSPKANNNLVRASNGGTVMINGVVVTQSASGALQAVGTGSFLDIYGSTISAGNINASGGGEARLVASNATFAGGVGGSGAFNILGGNTLVMNQPTWNHAGTVTVNFNTGGSGTLIRFVQSCAANGVNIRLNAHPANYDTSYLETPGANQLSMDSASSITGHGRLYATINLNGTLAPGDGTAGAGIGRFDGPSNVSLGSNALFDVEIGGTSTTQFDRITGTSFNANGTIKIRLANGFIPAGGEEFDVVSCNTSNGIFHTVDCERFNNGTNRFAVEYLPGKVRVRAKLCPADFDGDGFITGKDFDEFVIAFEAGNVLSDVDGDGFITGIDFDEFVQTLELGCEP